MKKEDNSEEYNIDFESDILPYIISIFLMLFINFGIGVLFAFFSFYFLR